MNHHTESIELRYRFLPYQVGGDLNDNPAPKSKVLRKKLGEKRAETMMDNVRDKLSSLGYSLYVYSLTDLGGSQVVC